MGQTHGPTESPAIVRIRGMSSNVPASGMPSTSCWLSACRRRFAEAVIVGKINYEAIRQVYRPEVK